MRRDAYFERSRRNGFLKGVGICIFMPSLVMKTRVRVWRAKVIEGGRGQPLAAENFDLHPPPKFIWTGCYA